MPREQQAKFKPLSFTTTIRNPARYPKFLSILSAYEWRILTEDIALRVAKDLILNKEYTPDYINDNAVLKAIRYDNTASFTPEQIDDIIEHSPQDHGEAWFPNGWPSRFDTRFKFAKELWFLWYAMDEQITISQTGHILIEALNQEQPDEQKIQQIFLNAMVKYQSKNPFRKTLNDNIPLMLLLNVIKKLKENNPESRWIHKLELSFFACWKDNNADALYEYILNFRRDYPSFLYSTDVVYENCLSILWETNRKYVKKDKVTKECIDEYIRKMRITWIFTLRWWWPNIFLDLDSSEQSTIDYVESNYQNYQLFDDCREYYDYMTTIDDNLLSETTEEIIGNDEIKIRKLREMAQAYSQEQINRELYNLCHRTQRNETRDPLLRYINDPVRLEFLTSIAIVQRFPNLEIKPNYIIDDEGFPRCTALWWMADIECFDWENNELTEVTLLCWRQQVCTEMIPIERHLVEAKRDNPNSYSIFIAPTIHPDARRYSEWIEHDRNLTIKTFSIDEFTLKLDESENFIDVITN